MPLSWIAQSNSRRAGRLPPRTGPGASIGLRALVEIGEDAIESLRVGQFVTDAGKVEQLHLLGACGLVLCGDAEDQVAREVGVTGEEHEAAIDDPCDQVGIRRLPRTGADEVHRAFEFIGRAADGEAGDAGAAGQAAEIGAVGIKFTLL